MSTWERYFIEYRGSVQDSSSSPSFPSLILLANFCFSLTPPKEEPLVFFDFSTGRGDDTFLVVAPLQSFRASVVDEPLCSRFIGDGRWGGSSFFAATGSITEGRLSPTLYFMAVARANPLYLSNAKCAVSRVKSA